jgi:hypothetical protein
MKSTISGGGCGAVFLFVAMGSRPIMRISFFSHMGSEMSDVCARRNADQHQCDVLINPGWQVKKFKIPVLMYV